MPTFRNTILKKEDFPKMVAANPAEMDLFLNTLNGMFSQLHTMLDRGILFGDNIAAQVKDVQVSEAQQFPISIGYTLPSSPQGVIILNARDTTPSTPSVQTSNNNSTTQQAVSVDWVLAGQQIQIRSFGGIDPKRRYVITVMIIGGT
jgi:hypothetical protein